MPKQQTEHLLHLVKSMTKSEKRGFRLFVSRNSSANEILFFQLFEVLDKHGVYDESLIFSKIPKLKKSQLSNVKANLFQQILNCLRLTKRSQLSEIRIREQIDYARILYDKGLYKSALETLDKAKKLAIRVNYETLIVSILYLEKRIESQHVTGCMADRVKELTQYSETVIDEIQLTNQLSNLSLMLYGKYLQYGYVKNQKDYEHILDFFEHHKPDVDLNNLNFYQRLYLIQSHVWFHNMTQNFSLYYKFAQRWLDLFHDFPERQISETPLYLKGIHNVLNALFMAQKQQKFEEVFVELKNFDIHSKLNVTMNEVSQYKLIYYVQYLNNIFLSCEYEKGAKSIESLEEEILNNPYNWDLNRMLIFYYKLGCVHFGANDCNQALVYLNKINNAYYPRLREDIQCFSRILSLIVHFDLGNEELVSYQLKQVYRFLLKLEELDAVFQEILKFLRRTPKMIPENIINEFKNLKTKLLKIKDKRFEKRPFLYLDIISWLDTKIENKSFQEVLINKKKQSDHIK